MGFLTYAGIVNKHSEALQLKKLYENLFKCLMYIIGLKSCKYADITTRLLSKIGRDEKDDILLEYLVDECHRILSLQEDTAVIEHRSGTRSFRCKEKYRRQL